MNELISREALQDVLEGQFSAMYGKEPKHWPASAHKTLDVVADAPAVDAEVVRHGEWEGSNHFYICSCCERLFDLGKPTNYCPNCGAKMDAEVRDA